MNFSLVKSFLPHMTKEDMRVMQVPNWYLSYYRRFPEKLENCKYKHIKAINDYIKQEKLLIINFIKQKSEKKLLIVIGKRSVHTYCGVTCVIPIE